ncbi:MAG: hypothetical protein EBR09_16465 [Proteobacteria bacterium]|nr:hypothetical protein [Pseudomonadota bacterium]
MDNTFDELRSIALKIEETQNDRSVGLRSRSLQGTTVALCVGGGIAAIEVPKVARELRRMGASVKILVTENALKFVGKDALEWASAESVTVQASGLAEHVSESDAVLVFPATADLIGKAAHGICTDACSTYIQSALGREQLVAIIPTMHESLSHSPATRANIHVLENYKGVEFIAPRKEEGKWKAPDPETVALEMAYRINRAKLRADGISPARAVVTLGGTLVKIDAARAVSNISTGTLGSIFIRKLLENGIQTTALCAHHTAAMPQCSGLDIVSVPEFTQLQENMRKITSETKVEGLFHFAAVSDYGPDEQTTAKISSRSEKLTLQMTKLPKLIEMKSIAAIKYKIACKFTSDNKTDEREKAVALMNTHSLNGVVWNWGSNAFGMQKQQEMHFLTPEAPAEILFGKKELADALTHHFLTFLKNEKTQASQK